MASVNSRQRMKDTANVTMCVGLIVTMVYTAGVYAALSGIGVGPSVVSAWSPSFPLLFPTSRSFHCGKSRRRLGPAEVPRKCESRLASTASPPSETDGSKGARRTKRQIHQLKYVMYHDVEELIKSGNPTSVDRVKHNIERLEKLHDAEGEEEYEPTVVEYNQLILAFAKAPPPATIPTPANQRRRRRGKRRATAGGDDAAARQAEEILNQMMCGGEHQVCYTASAGNSQSDADQEGASEEEEAFKEICTCHKMPSPDAVTFTTVIDAYARSGAPNAAQNAERILDLMMKKAETDDSLAPTSVTCDVVLKAWAKMGTKEAAERAETILERMEDLRSNGNSKIRPTFYSFATVISAWSHSGVEGPLAAERAESILDRLIAMYREATEEYKAELLPNHVCFNTVIDSWARSGDPRAGTKAEALLVRMEEMSTREGIASAAPDVITYNSCINAWSNSGHITAANSAERVLQKMKDAADAAEAQDVDAELIVRPTTRTYNSLLKAYAKSHAPNAARRAERVLTYMMKEYKEGAGDVTVAPDTISFSTVLDACAKCRELPHKAAMAQSILQRMTDFHYLTGRCPPNTVVFNTVINACAFSLSADEEEQRQALQIAIHAFNQMRQIQAANDEADSLQSEPKSHKTPTCRPDSVTYGTLLKCCANLVPVGKARNSMASQLFERCAEEGLVNDLVLNEVRRAVSPDAFRTLVVQHLRHKPAASIVVMDLPRAWRLNVREKRGGGGGGAAGGATSGTNPSAGQNKRPSSSASSTAQQQQQQPSSSAASKRRKGGPSKTDKPRIPKDSDLPPPLTTEHSWGSNEM